MTNGRTFVILGAGLAGAKAAETLRAEGFDGRIVLVGSERGRPYERPPLSKDYLRGELEREQLRVHDEDFYAGHDIELRLGRTAVSLWRPALRRSREPRRSSGSVPATGRRSTATTTWAWSTRDTPQAWDRVVLRGDPASREFIAFWLVGDRVVAGMNVGVWDVTEQIQHLIRARVPVDDRRLADTDIPLEDLTLVPGTSTA